MDIASIVKNKIDWLIQWATDYYPSAIVIGITNKCNLQCIMCSRDIVTKKWPQFLESVRENHPKFLELEMSFERFEEIVNQFPNLKFLCLVSAGENLLNKDFLKMLRYAKKRNIYVEFYDNFYFLDEKIAEQIIEIGVDKIWVSMDGATKETYEKIRIGSDFDRVIKNVKRLFSLKKKKQKIYPEIVFNYVINTYNYGEVLAFIDLARSIAGKEKFSIQFIDTINFTGNQAYLCLERDIAQKIISQATQKAKKIGIKINYIDKIKKPIINCQRWLTPSIVAPGYIFPCCSAPNHGIIMGDIVEKSFKQAWNDKRYKNFRKDIRMGKTPAFCENCEFYGKN